MDAVTPVGFDAFTALEHLPVAVGLVDADGTLRYVNRAAGTIYGLDRQDMVGKSALAMTVGASDTAAAAEMMAGLQPGDSWSGHFPVTRDDGTRIDAWYALASVPAVDGGEPMLVVVAVDIAPAGADGDTGPAGKAAEARAQEANVLLEALLHSVPVGMAFYDRSLRFVRVNAAMAAMSGRPAHDHIGRTLAEVIDEPPAGMTEDVCAVFASGETIVQREVFGRTAATPDEDRYWIVNYYPVTLGDEVLWVGSTMVEVTESRRAEAERLQLLEAERTARLAAERSAERLARLQIVTGRLAEASDEAEVADIVVLHGSQGVNAAGGAMCLLDGDRLRVVRSAGMVEASVRRIDGAPLDVSLPATDAVRRREPVFIRSIEERDRLYPSLADIGTVNQASAAIPMLVDGKVIGSVVLVWSEPQPFEAGESGFLLALGRQAAQALERARLHGAERRARADAELAWEKMRFLADASRALSASLDFEVTLVDLARLALREVADAFLIHLLDGDELRLAVAASNSPDVQGALRRAAGGPTRDRSPRLLGRVVVTGESVVLPYITPDFWSTVAEDAEALATLRSLHLESAVLAPLRVRDRIIGVLSLGTQAPRRHYDEPDLAFVEDLAGRVAVAIENSRSHKARTEVAQTLQRSLLPPHLPRIPGLDLAQRYHSLGDVEVGGDFFDVFPAGDGRWGVVMGDVCGKGVGAAALTALARYTVRAGAIDEGQPSKVLRLLNRAILEADAGERFCTIVYSTLEPGPDGIRVTLVCGGHPLPLLLAAGGEVRTVGVPGTAIGLFEEIDLTEVEVTLLPGDALVLFTDGFTEVRSPDGAFDPDLLGAAVATAAGRSAEGIAEVVDRAVLAFEGGRQRDDMALLILKMPAGR